VRKLLTIIFFILVANLTLVNAANIPKSGATCSKLGQSSIYLGKKYVCIKSGKKLIWDKGTIISVKSPTPTPTKLSIPKYTSPEDLSVCRIPQKNKLEGIPFFAYPVNPQSIYAMLPQEGPLNAVVIPIDFTDAPGDFVPKDFLTPQIKLIDEWMTW
jgi:hypothetical protein